MWERMRLHCRLFDGELISWNTPFFTIIILYPEVSLKVFVNFKLIWFSLCYTKILQYTCGGVVRYFNMLMLGTILTIFVSLTFLEILWSIKTKEPMET